ncbi:5-methylcytosine-specific restriction enzyme A [Sphingobacterium nematocida]|uniref:5-methylcytosine-specific restriction enzyme A n=1 Tax=Sphingobacterium nematocida TaxID=1513896 RepID=A0A1T5B0A1_9SPHI|nr:HNH endonuclease [Sphingobacterium nematocida]SKB40636.1 5-methylcytosine-specific restriction enzyme A [Sphingobacterium nematocida]
MDKKRNPKWQRDELILALDLYFQLEPGQIHARNPLIIDLSDTLNKLPIHGDKEEYEKFRNPNGVGLKLSNFLALDDSYTGKGMSSTSRLDKEVFQEFKNQKDLLRKLATAIKATLEYPDINAEILNAREDIEDSDFERSEGTVLYRYHLARERNATLVKKKKQQALKLHGKLECELCSFDFFKTYGEIGYGFIECHHRTPLYELTESTVTKLDDLMLVCANCHRMLHRGWIMSQRIKY